MQWSFVPIIETLMPSVVLPLLLGVSTKLADISHDDGYRLPLIAKVGLGVLWGGLGAVVVLFNTDIAAFYFGILISWIVRFKLDNYSHGIGGALVLVAIYAVSPFTLVQVFISTLTFMLFTAFGLLTRHGRLKKSAFTEYNIYSFIFLFLLTFWYPPAMLVFIASLSNVIGYHYIKQWWKGRDLHRSGRSFELTV